MKFIKEKVKSEFVHSVALVLAAVAVCVLLSFPVSALVKTASASPRSGGETTGAVTVNEEFGRGDWESLDQAAAYYGWDKYYTLSTPIYRNGYCYQYYYVFSDGSRMYFGVIS